MNDPAPLFTILIPTWNNLPYLRLCIDSLRRHSAYRHQIIVHVNDGSDGTLQWVKEQGLQYTHTPSNVGVCLAMNMMRPLVATPYMLYVNDDMYALPGWDTALWNEIQSRPDNMWYLSSTTLQPHVKAGSTIIQADYGSGPEDFRPDELLRDYQRYEIDDWAGSTIPPALVHRDLWDLVGGYSIELSPGMYSDPEFTAKLWMVGVRWMKGLSASRFYHFQSRSTGRVRRNDGRTQFLLKWGISSSTFRRLYTRRGKTFDPALINAPVRRPRLQLLRARFKGLWHLLTGPWAPITTPWRKQ